MQKKTKWIVATVAIIVAAVILIWLLVAGLSGDKLLDMGAVVNKVETPHHFIFQARGRGYAGFKADSTLANAFGVKKEDVQKPEFEVFNKLEDWVIRLSADSSIPATEANPDAPYDLAGLAFFNLSEEDFLAGIKKLNFDPLTFTKENLKPIGQKFDTFYGYTMRRGKALLVFSPSKDRLFELADRITKLPEGEKLPPFPEKKDGLSIRAFTGHEAMQQALESYKQLVQLQLPNGNLVTAGDFMDKLMALYNFTENAETYMQITFDDDRVKMNAKSDEKALKNFAIKMENKQPGDSYQYIGTDKLVGAVAFSYPGLSEDIDLNKFLPPQTAADVLSYLESNGLTVKDLVKVLQGRTTLTLSQPQDPAGPLQASLFVEKFPKNITNKLIGLANFLLNPRDTENLDSDGFKGIVTRLPLTNYQFSLGMKGDATLGAFGNAVKMKSLDVGEAKSLGEKGNTALYIDFPSFLDGLSKLPEGKTFILNEIPKVAYNLKSLEMSNPNLLEAKSELIVLPKDKQIPIAWEMPALPLEEKPIIGPETEPTPEVKAEPATPAPVVTEEKVVIKQDEPAVKEEQPVIDNEITQPVEKPVFEVLSDEVNKEEATASEEGEKK